MDNKNWKLEENVNDYIKEKLKDLGLKSQEDYNIESNMSDYMKESLSGGAKTKSKKNFGKPDFNMEKYNIPVVFEVKLGASKLAAKDNKKYLKFDEKSIKDYASNGALHYARHMIKSCKYKEAIAIGLAGDNRENFKIEVYFVYGSAEKANKIIDNCSELDFLENEDTFKVFYNEAVLSEEEKSEILIKSRNDLQRYAKDLNKLMHNHNISAPQRVLYVSGMLLSMQDIVKDGSIIQDGLTPEDLKGIQTESKRDGKLVIEQINEFLTNREIPREKQELMMSSFKEISKDSQRDQNIELDKKVSKMIEGNSSANKQIFTFIYENVYKQIDGLGSHIDIMGEMYSEFLKYALGDGKEIGIVLTPPYVTKMMVEILGINYKSRVMDLATGSAGFLISSMEMMIEDANRTFGKNTSKANEEIENIKKKRLLGVELNAEMFTLATTNMILRGDGKSNIKKGSSFDRPAEIYDNFKATNLLLNPPFSFKENGMPFIKFGLNHMEKGGLGAIIIQDSAGSGKAVESNKAILKNHTLVASIKMPPDLFQPMAGVQTSIYILKSGKPHDFDIPVKFIDFRNDGYKRTGRGTNEIDNPSERYKDIIKLYKGGTSSKINEKLLDIEKCYVEDLINESGADWNFDKHQVIDIVPILDDFKNTVADCLKWEISNII